MDARRDEKSTDWYGTRLIPINSYQSNGSRVLMPSTERFSSWGLINKKATIDSEMTATVCPVRGRAQLIIMSLSGTRTPRARIREAHEPGATICYLHIDLVVRGIRGGNCARAMRRRPDLLSGNARRDGSVLLLVLLGPKYLCEIQTL